MYNSQGNYIIAFSVYGRGTALTRIEYQSEIKQGSRPSVDDVLSDILYTFGAKLYKQIVRIWTLEYTDTEFTTTETIWFSDLEWDERTL